MEFQLVCELCFGNCDQGGSLTSCKHFICSNCVPRLTAGAPCPLCHQSYSLLRLDGVALQPLLRGSADAVGNALNVVRGQLQHLQIAIRRMRQALATVSTRHRACNEQLHQMRAERMTAASQVHALQAEVCRLREELARSSTAKTAAAPFPTQRAEKPPISLGYTEGAVPPPSAGPVDYSRTPHGQVIPSPSTTRSSPFLPPKSATPPFQPNSACPSSRRVPSNVSSAPAFSPKSSHARLFDPPARGVPVHHSQARVGPAGEPPMGSLFSTPPLGWSASSVIAKRHRSDGQTSFSVERPRSSVMGSAHPAPPSPVSLSQGPVSTAPSLLVNQRYGGVSSTSSPFNLRVCGARHSSSGGDRDRGNSVDPSVDLRRLTPRETTRQPQVCHPSPYGALFHQTPSPKPLQHVFNAVRRTTPQ